MTKKILLSLIIITLSLQAGEFINYKRAFKISLGQMAYNADPGFYLGIGYEQQIGKTVIELNMGPKFNLRSSPYGYFYNDTTDIIIKGKTFSDVTYYSWYQRELSAEFSILFSHRPPIKVRNGNGAFTFNLWRYGLVFEWQLWGSTSYHIDDNFYDAETNFKHYNKMIGILYKPSLGVQISNKINISFELQYSINIGGSRLANPNFKYGGGYVLTLSNPIKE